MQIYIHDYDPSAHKLRMPSPQVQAEEATQASAPCTVGEKWRKYNKH
jgi:hypothetical protein